MSKANEMARRDLNKGQVRIAFRHQAQIQQYIWWEFEAPLAVLVTAASEEEAKQKVLADIANPDDPELTTIMEQEYGSTWFLKPLSPQTL